MEENSYRLVVSEPASKVDHVTEVGRSVLLVIHSKPLEGTDSSRHRLSDKVNYDLTLGRISGLLPASREHRIVSVSSMSVFSSCRMLQSISTFRVLHAASTLPPRSGPDLGGNVVCGGDCLHSEFLYFSVVYAS